MPADEVKGELEQVENELEMNHVTNRNVIEQYQQRQAQVRVLCFASYAIRSPFCQIERVSQDLAEEEARAEKISNSIETARVCFYPSNGPSMGILIGSTDVVGARTQGPRFQHWRQIFRRVRPYDCISRTPPPVLLMGNP